MKKLIDHINNRNRSLTADLHQLQSELQQIFESKILHAGITQPGYFNDFYPVLDNLKRSGLISRYMITEEEYTNDGEFYKIPVIDVTVNGQQSNSRIFLYPVR